MKLSFYNTASKSIEDFKPINRNHVSIYSCGLTVNYFAHIGNYRAYTTSDLLRRVLEYSGFNVRHAMNITDVGHMTSDEDDGEDKLLKAAKEEQKSPWEVGRFYEDYFLSRMKDLNILKPHVVPRATEHIDIMIELIKKLQEKGFVYKSDVGIMFDTSLFSSYADFAGLDLEKMRIGEKTKNDESRRNAADFALWITNQPNHLMQWDSPWGKGFPGWHIECSALSMHYLGETIDFHTGGMDHISIHHTNEIAQSESVSGKKFVNGWLHTAFLKIKDEKMSKSLRNLYTVDDLKDRGFSPLALRYFYFSASYRKPLVFSFEALENAQNALEKLWKKIDMLPMQGTGIDEYFIREFENRVFTDLNMPYALEIVWKLVNADIPEKIKAATLIEMDKILGLDFMNARTQLNDLKAIKGYKKEHEQKAQKLLEERLQAKKAKDYGKADDIRVEIESLGFSIRDEKDGSVLRFVGTGKTDL